MSAEIPDHILDLEREAAHSLAMLLRAQTLSLQVQKEIE